VKAKNNVPVGAEDFSKKIEEKFLSRKNSKKQTQLRKQQRKRKKEKYYA
jgi:hypothetical protein